MVVLDEIVKFTSAEKFLFWGVRGEAKAIRFSVSKIPMRVETCL